VHDDKIKLRNLLKGRVDWMLLDVPCSGSGVLRRNPDMKWKFKKISNRKHSEVQKEIPTANTMFSLPVKTPTQ
jgi:16S rRNA C967 or C1407 C5-methylase (RsmB/RsmF family)